jgi:hypothetical protein
VGSNLVNVNCVLQANDTTTVEPVYLQLPTPQRDSIHKQPVDLLCEDMTDVGVQSSVNRWARNRLRFDLNDRKCSGPQYLAIRCH